MSEHPGHHCSVHDLAAGPDGRCALCRRADPPPTSSSRYVLPALALLALAAGGAFVAKRAGHAADAGPATLQEAAEMPASAVRLYTTAWCPHCKRAKEWLASNHVDYTEIDVERHPGARQEHRRVSPRGTIPVLDANGQVVVGFSADDYRRAIEEGAHKP